MSDFSTLLAWEKPIQSYNYNQVVNGTVILANPKMILVDLEWQFTGIITGPDMTSSTSDMNELAPWDLIEAIVIGDDARSGLIQLSLRKASQIKLIEKLNTNFDTKEIITVIPNEANKGWLLIDLDGIKWFIPVSQLTPAHYPRVEGANPEKILEHLNKLVGKAFQVRVITVDQQGKKIIFSEKAAVMEQRTQTLQNLKVGDVVEGTISWILTYGLFVSFHGIEWLVHVSEIDWGHVNNPHKFGKIGDKVTVQVIGIEGEKISLSIKRLRPNPWQVLADKYQVGDIVEAPILRLSQFGIFLEIEGWISWLVHLSEIPVDMAKHLEETIHVGEMLQARIITFDPTSKRIGLSLKALDPNYVPSWEEHEWEQEVEEEETSKKKIAKKPEWEPIEHKKSEKKKPKGEKNAEPKTQEKE